MRVRPGEFFLTFCNSCQLWDSLASTMRLRTPSCSMKAMTFCCAPAPMESMATTAATPKIMPSMVRRERSLWLARFSKPKTTSGSHCCSDRGSAKELGLMGMCLASLGARTETGIGSVASLLFSGAIFLRIHEGHDRSRRNAIEDRPAFTQRADFDFLHFETPVAFAIHYLLAVVFEDSLARNGNGARKIVPQDAQPDREARAEARIGLVKLDSHIKFVLGVIVPKFVARRAADVLHFAGKGFTGKRIDFYLNGLAGLQVGAVGFAYLRGYFQVGNVDNFRDGASRIDLIADVIVWERHPIHEKPTRRVPVAVNNHQTVNRRGDVHVLDVLFRLLHSESRLVTFLLGERQCRLS